MLFRSRFYLSSKSKLTLYYSLIYPYITYCNSTWSSTYVTNLNRIYCLQKRALCEMRSIVVLKSHDTDPYSSRIRTYPDVPCSQTREVSTACQEPYSFRFGLNPCLGKSDVRIRHGHAACGDLEISLYFQICRK